jgi:hypothetical protein
MSSEHPPWFENYHSFNCNLFEKTRAIVISLGIPNCNVESVDVGLLSACGSFSWEVSASVVTSQPWNSNLFDAILSDRALMTALGDFSFAHFRKSDLFRAVLQEIIYPIQVLSDFSPVMQPKEIVLNDEVLIATGIRHSVQGSKGRIDCLRGVVPAADEFYIWSDELECFADPDRFRLEECITQIAGPLLEMTEFCGPPLTMQQIRQIASPLFPTPETPQELWKLHCLMGTLSGGELIV